MILKGVNLNKVYNDSSRQEYIKEYGHYYLDIELNNDKVLVYDKGEIVDEILLDKAVKILFERRKTFKVILMEEGYYVIRFCDIHKHSAYSILDGMSTIKDIVKKTEYCGALTDHGNMYGFLKFYNAMISANKKPIIGFEAYTEPYFKGEVTKKGARAHLILLAKNKIGFKNIVKLCSIGFEKGYKSKKTVKPIIPYEDLLKHKDGIIVTSACLGGDIQKNLMKDGKDSIEKAYEIAKLFKDNFGEDYYIEIQRHNMQEELKVNFHLLNIADKLGIKAVAGIDSHYIEEEDRYYQEILLASNTGTTMSNPNRWVFEGDRYHMLTSEDMEELFGDMPELLDNTLEIADKVNLEIETGNYHLPEFEVPDEFKIHKNPKNSKELDENQYSYLHYLCRKGMDEKGFTGVKEYEERLDFELGVIRRMGYSAYFLIVWDFVSWAKSQGILVGPGRGSACGSLASYVLTITDVDPLRYGLLFERFLSPDRVSMPDKWYRIIIGLNNF